MEARESTGALIARSRGGDSASARSLAELVYDELRSIARTYLAREAPGHTLQPTALVHEALARLIGDAALDGLGRTHFLAISAGVMRRVLVEHARARAALRRGGENARVTLSDAAASRSVEIDVLELEEALERLTQQDERLARVVELRFFGGLSVDQAAEQLGVSPRTVGNDWRMARAWLRRELGGGGA